MKSGMKQTEIGEIPADWEVVKLGDIISDLKSGVSVNSEDKRISLSGEIGILKTSAIANGHFLPNQHKLVVDKDVQRAKLNPIVGSILISRMNTPALVGDSCYVGKDYPNLFIPDRLWMTIFNPKKKISSRWLSFVLISDSFKEVIRNTATGTSNSMKNISKGRFLSLEVALPPLPEQRKIAGILSTLDEKMAMIDEQLAQTQELKKGLMQRLLTRGIGHTEFKDSPLGEVPASWEVRLLDEVTKRGSGHTPSKNFPEYYNGGIKWISLADSAKLDNGWIKETKTSISNLGIKNSSATLHSKGTVLLSRDAGIGKSAVMHEDMAVSQHFITWTCTGRINNWFLYYYLQLSKPLFERIAAGSTIKTIGLPFFKKFSIPVPSFLEQEQIAEILTTIDDKIGVLQDKKAQYHTLKKGLMQQLLTGQRRVRVAPEVAALA
jgi:type I restriction enzyme, S subunit